jgi:hypothetical protein
MNEVPHGPANSFPWLIGESEGRSHFCNGFSDRREIHGLAVQQSLNDVLMIDPVCHIQSP